MYKNTKRVRINCGDQFVKDFRSHRSLCVWAKQSGKCLEVSKSEVWRAAERGRVDYKISTDIYANGREVMVIL